MVHQREWPSFTAMEAAYGKLFAESDIQALDASGSESVLTERTEFYHTEAPR